ncbi:hypothetical protein [Kutzneria sp. 744]|uniref:hypothetical protein n=1 Tax=Kutzneria sp. (strain 744) TaxID=345341 RepID=UPI0003EEDAFF|nr:hypothetical protein [Kutzneria sp. 744]EWM13682.1 hypothetical protein KUTG_03986 [Kutzneria sp. 744]
MPNVVAPADRPPEQMAARAQAFQQLYDWPVCVSPETGDLVLAVRAGVDAITVRGELGVQAQRLLCTRLLAGPVLLLPKKDPEQLPDWVFLTGPAQNLSRQAVADIGRVGVRLWPHDEFVPLPPSRLPGGEVRWSTSPILGRPLPSWISVIGAIRSVAADGGAP